MCVNLSLVYNNCDVSYVSAIFNALCTMVCTLEYTQTRVLFQRHKGNVLVSGQEILAENRIVSLALKSQRTSFKVLPTGWAAMIIRVLIIHKKDGVGHFIMRFLINFNPIGYCSRINVFRSFYSKSESKANLTVRLCIWQLGKPSTMVC